MEGEKKILDFRPPSKKSFEANQASVAETETEAVQNDPEQNVEVKYVRGAIRDIPPDEKERMKEEMDFRRLRLSQLMRVPKMRK